MSSGGPGRHWWPPDRPLLHPDTSHRNILSGQMYALKSTTASTYSLFSRRPSGDGHRYLYIRISPSGQKRVHLGHQAQQMDGGTGIAPTIMITVPHCSYIADFGVDSPICTAV